MSISLLVRGDESWGSGHLYRASWLLESMSGSGIRAQGCQVCSLDSALARDFWSTRAMSAEYFASPEEIAEALPPNGVVVIDWLDSDPGFVAGLRSSGQRVILLDDYGPARYEASLVVNALLSPLELSFERLAGTATNPQGAAVHSGAAWVQLPPAAVKLRNTAAASAQAMETELSKPLPAEQAGRIYAALLSFGGVSKAHVSELALEALRLAGFAGTAILIPCHQAPSPQPFAVNYHAGGEEFHSLLAAADLAICAGGLSLYEAAFLGIPAICVPLNDHQYATACKLESAGCCINAGLAEELKPQELAAAFTALLSEAASLRRMSAAGLALFDGRGLQRTSDAILDLAAGTDPGI